MSKVFSALCVNTPNHKALTMYGGYYYLLYVRYVRVFDFAFSVSFNLWWNEKLIHISNDCVVVQLVARILPPRAEGLWEEIGLM